MTSFNFVFHSVQLSLGGAFSGNLLEQIKLCAFWLVVVSSPDHEQTKQSKTKSMKWLLFVVKIFIFIYLFVIFFFFFSNFAVCGLRTWEKKRFNLQAVKLHETRCSDN